MNKQTMIFLVMMVITLLSVGLGLLHDSLSIFANRGNLWTMVIFFSVIVTITIWRDLLKRNKDQLEPIIPFLIVFTLYTLMLPINDLINSRYLDSDALYRYLVVAHIGLGGFLCGYYLIRGEKLGATIPTIEIGNKELWFAGFLLFAIGCVSFAVNVAAFGGFGEYFGMGYGPQRYLIIRQQITFGYGWEWIGLSLLIFLVVSIKQKLNNTVFFLVVLILIWIILSFWLGYRRPIVYFLLILFITYNYLFRRVRLRPFILLAIIFYMILVAYGYTRTLLPQYGVLKALSETVGFVLRRPDLVLPVVSGEFNLVARSITEIITSEFVKLKFGESYLVALFSAIPGMGRIMPDQLLALAEWRVITFYPGLYEAGAGLGFHALAEGLVNFGLLGVIFHMFFYGAFMRIAYGYLRSAPRNNFVVLLYAVTIPILLFDAIRSDLTASFFKWTHTYIGPILFVLIVAHLVNKISEKVESKND